MRSARAGLLYFLMTFGAGFALGPIRLFLLVPRIGVRAAELIELPVMILISYLAARWITSAASPCRRRRRHVSRWD